jgi:hypothetical protein
VSLRLTHFAVRWHHSFPDEPVDLYSELDENRFELRKVEAFADGRMSYAGLDSNAGDTELGTLFVPPLSEIASEEFAPREIDASEFESIWHAAHQYADGE